jgi:hypothetical protein
VSPAATGDAVVASTLLEDLVQGQGEPTAQAVVYGDSAYGTGAHLAWLDAHGLTPMVKTQVPTAPGGRFAKDQFRLDLQAGTVTCPARVTVAIRPARQGGGRAWFGRACSVCPLRAACTTSVRGRVVAIHPYEAKLAGGRARQRDPAWLADYRATRPKVERKLAHLLRRRHGGRRARVRGLVRVAQDSKLLAAAVNLARWPPSGCVPRPTAGRSSRPDRAAGTEFRSLADSAQPAERPQAVRQQQPPRSRPRLEDPFGLDNGPAEAAERILAARRRVDGGGEAVLGGAVDDCAAPPDPAAGGLELGAVHLPAPVPPAWRVSEHPLPQPRPRSAVCPEPGRQQQSAPAEGPLNGGGGHLVAVGTHHRGDLAVPPGGPIRCVLRGDCLDRVHSRRRPWPLRRVADAVAG